MPTYTPLEHAISDHPVLAITGRHIRSFIRCDIPWVNDALPRESAAIEAGAQPETNTKRWLLHHVLRILHQEIEEDRERNDAEMFDAYPSTLLSGRLPAGV